MIFAVISILLLVLVWLFHRFYRNTRNKMANNNAHCSSCKTPLRAKDIVDETLAGDGLDNGGKTRKIIVTMRCPTCYRDKKLTIYTDYRHHVTKGSPARQYFKDIEEKEWAQMTKQD